ncbi:MAG: 4Fe-4S binding protein [Rhodobacteraceae bacterium]|jgi:NosR/NirI family nitrous oxide reductase transcriptional regulator|uniref:Regulator of nitric oxide reductase transcription n=1 Tax=Salipiger profundus TaxID=1229727 RepID=A0A1U7D0U6_9RHOB|nr:MULTISPECIES: 4Fe-4S binding protein [Salipiger]APX21777.1 regulator of nitric oxide reductase transcription [Salipiger profundus]MAB04468.1 4Fe-4S binding protein [Paracoccaceae bacterium]GFZ99950.1 regulatory protein NosR [Salipiger profundus]SFC07394.1 Regulator of nitric oxide reductase transcription [Salipiger profundus]
MRLILAFLLFASTMLLPGTGKAAPLDREAMSEFVYAPYVLGEPVNDKGVWELLNSGGGLAGYAFETILMAPLPGFSGAPINIFAMLDLDGRFLDVRLIDHNEPIFVSGLGEAPLRRFFEQYAGHAISESMVVGNAYGRGDGGSALVYLDGVTKATASARIAHESLMAAAREVARETMQGITTGPPAHPDPDHDEQLSWSDLVAEGIATHAVVSNAELQARFDGTIWADDDPEATDAPDDAYLDLWVVDLGPPSIARAALGAETFAELQRFLSISPDEEPILLIERGRHGLVSPEFVRNTAPDWLSAEQDGLPIALRDADLLVELAEGVPDGTAMILRTDRRLGFDPSREWTLKVEAVREHGMFQPQIGREELLVSHATPERFFERPGQVAPLSPWREAILGRQTDLVLLCGFLIALLLAVGPAQNRLAGLTLFTPVRLGFLAVMTGFVGFWGQGQLSIVTVLGVLRAALEGGSFAFLLYDPFSALVWAAAIAGFVLWGRGFFCGWLCPFGALQEFAAHFGRLLRLPQIEPSATWDRRLKGLKYLVLSGLVGVAFLAPSGIDTAAEVEPFKTAITTGFQREWYYVAWAVGLLLLSAVLFKGFCRYLCPLGAVMAIGGLLRGRDWIARRAECGSPCQLCKVRCRYGAIERSGKIAYSECFQCLDCVKIHDDPQQCVPLVLAQRERKRAPAPESDGVPAE